MRCSSSGVGKSVVKPLRQVERVDIGHVTILANVPHFQEPGELWPDGFKHNG
jgi:hypothetical protein